MHLQEAVEPFDLFVRCLGIGSEVRFIRYDPTAPQHERYQTDTDFLTADEKSLLRDMTLTINSFFGWDFNSCEVIRKDGVFYPIDFANACPDSQVTSLHYHFPWLVKTMLAWSTFCAATKRPMRTNLDWDRYHAIRDEKLSYRELDARANQLAHRLGELGVVPESRVGILLERSTEMIVALLGVLKAGGAYVPLDPGHPAARLSYQLEDAGVAVLITREELQARVPEIDVIILDLDAEREQIAGKSREAFVAWRERRDASLAAPKLLFQSVQVNVDAGRMPDPAANGRRYLKIPINVFRPDPAPSPDAVEYAEVPTSRPS